MKLMNYKTTHTEQVTKICPYSNFKKITENCFKKLLQI